MKYKKLFFISIVTFFLSNNLFAQNIAYANKDSLLITIPKYSDNLRLITEEKTKYKNELEEEKKKNNLEFETLLKPYNLKENGDYETLKGILSKEDASMLDIVYDEQEAIDKKIKSYQELILLKYNENIKPLLDKVDFIIASYCKSKNIDAVYNISEIDASLIYLNKSKIITKNLIQEIIKKYK